MNFEAKLPKTLMKFNADDPMTIMITAESDSDYTALLALMNAVGVPGLISEAFNHVVAGVFNYLDDKVEKVSPAEGNPPSPGRRPT